ncbi:heat shock protein beta-3 [Aplochiton taeniatus]
MEGLTITHCVACPVRHQAYFEGRDLDDCCEDHFLFALPGPSLSMKDFQPAGGSDPSLRPAYQVMLDVSQFRPEDILIQVFEGWLLIKAQHGVRMDEHGFVSRSFTRQYDLPEQIKGGSDLRALLCHDGILIVESKD